ncbi:hypothetical protein DS031_08045 [Bacillus taeanensis]|uniref:Uncharacterized protein n=2 Tax=Bacillus taeanensis TaxID=273032 RepID=A0A366Y1W9_9BACI|nr:hypothetical protein DS031_08045 [Bacillus taeanensis]
MQMRNFVLYGDILSVQVEIEDKDYTFGVKRKDPKKPYDDTWELKSYCNNAAGERDLKEEQIKEFMEVINPNWNWNIDGFKK